MSQKVSLKVDFPLTVIRRGLIPFWDVTKNLTLGMLSYRSEDLKTGFIKIAAVWPSEKRPPRSPFLTLEVKFWPHQKCFCNFFESPRRDISKNTHIVCLRSKFGKVKNSILGSKSQIWPCRILHLDIQYGYCWKRLVNDIPKNCRKNFGEVKIWPPRSKTVTLVAFSRKAKRRRF